jgi:hypothetical protein
MDHPLRCRCGTLKGNVSRAEKAIRGICYCKHCQAYARFLGRADVVLDELGGTDVVATLPKRVTFTEGVESLTCMSFSQNGLLRWYANCCNTAIGNTPRNFKVSYLGLVHTCLEGKSLDDTFGPARMHVNTSSAKGRPERTPLTTSVAALRLLTAIARARIDRSYRRTPFFDGSGTPVVRPRVLSSTERRQVLDAE